VKQVDGSHFLRSITSRVLKARSNVIDSSTVKSLEDTYHFLREVVHSESENPETWRLRIVQLLQSKAEHMG